MPGITTDWMQPVLDSKTGAIKSYKIGNTYHLEQRIIEELKLTKYEGILLQNNKPLLEELLDPTFRVMRRESKGAMNITTSMAKEVAARVKAVVESPIDDRDYITFNNKTINFKKTRELGHLVIEPKRENLNSVQWDLLTHNEIQSSPKHKEMMDYLVNMIKGWKVDNKILFKIGAYAMCKENFADKVFFFKGKGGEGKGTANEMIRKLFEPSASKSYDPVNLKLGSEMAFVGTQIVFNDDLDDGKINTTHIKPVATNGDIEIRPLYQSSRTIKPYSTMIFNTNHDIKVGSNAIQKAWNDREFVIEFKGPNYRGTEQAKEFKKINPLNNKYFMDVFASFCAMHLPELINEEFNDDRSISAKEETAAVKDNVVQKFINEFNPVNTYWDKKLMKDMPLAIIEGKTTIKELYNYFVNWANESGERFKPNKTDFAKQFTFITGIPTKVKTPTYNNGKVGRWIDLSSILKGDEDES